MPDPDVLTLARRLKETERQLRLARAQIAVFHEELDRLQLPRLSEQGHHLTLVTRLHDLPLRAALLCEEPDPESPTPRPSRPTGRLLPSRPRARPCSR